MKIFLLLILCISNFIFAKEYKHELSVCAIFRDDAKYIPEWIEFHQKQGVTHFYLYNNLSSDDYIGYLSPYIKSGIVDLIEWSYEQKNSSDWNFIQCAAYMHCINTNKETTRWIACIDTDEFLFCPKKKFSVADLLYYYRDYGGVSVNWVMYGSSNVECLLPHEKMVDRLVMRGHLSEPANLHVKTIVQAQFVTGCVNPHYFQYCNNRHAVTEKFKFIDGPFSKVNSVERLRINHYWQRDLQFFWDVKVARQKKWTDRSNELYDDIARKYNDVYDPF